MPPKKRRRQKEGAASPNSGPDEESIGRELASFISERHEPIVLDWEKAVRRDQTIPSADKLTHRQLTDHIPELLTSISLTLSEEYDQKLAKDINYTASMHGQIRWQQGYDISELLREIGHLRTVLIQELRKFQRRRPDFSDAPGEVATIIVHSYLDKLMRRSIEQFLALSERAKPKQ